MPIQDFGAVCDISVLTNQNKLKNAHKYFQNSGLYLPSHTYSWLSRSKLIEVRHQAVKYSLINQEVQKRKVYPTHLPDLYDEISRQIMFNTNHKVALTDLRGLMLGAHLQLPVLTFDEKLVERISKEIGIITLHKIKAHPDWLTLRNILELYRELSFGAGKCFHEQIDNGKTFPKIIREIESEYRETVKKTSETIKEKSQKQANPGHLKFHYLAWDILPDLKEYYEQNILPPETMKQICERTTLLIATPSDLKKSENSQKQNSN